MIDSGGVRVRSIFWDEGNHVRDWKLPETLDEWREKVSPVILFSRLIAKSRSAFSKSRVIFKKPTCAKKAESFSKIRRRLFGAKNCQMSQL
jgi:hypothetical protein